MQVAPPLRLNAEWLVVEMEYLTDHETLFSLSSATRKPLATLQDWDAATEAVHAALSDAQARVLTPAGGPEEGEVQRRPYVHGDVRLNNVMVRDDGGAWSVKFIDFDWAGVDGQGHYPALMNVEVEWPGGAGPLCVMRAVHDNELLATQCRGARERIASRAAS